MNNIDLFSFLLNKINWAVRSDGLPLYLCNTNSLMIGIFYIYFLFLRKKTMLITYIWKSLELLLFKTTNRKNSNFTRIHVPSWNVKLSWFQKLPELNLYWYSQSVLLWGSGWTVNLIDTSIIMHLIFTGYLIFVTM